MPRAIWTGSLSFGLVNVPVGLFSATDDKAIHFNQFQAGTPTASARSASTSAPGEEVEYAEVVKGYDLGGGEYVIVTPEELESVEPGRSRTIEITDFVDLDAIDPIYYKSTYYLGPQGEQAVRPYALLREAMAQSNKVAVASLVLRTKEHLVTIRPTQSVLALETMYFADEIRDPMTEIPGVPSEVDFSGRELSTAKLLIDSMASNWDPSIYEDEYRKRVEGLIDEKRQGKVIVTERPETAADEGRGPHGGVAGQRGGGAIASTGRAHHRARCARPRRRPSGRPSAPRHRRAPAGDLSGLSKSELQARATELGIPGRSKMTREELEAAVAGAAKPAKRRKAS